MVLGVKKFFFQFLFDILPLGFGSVDPHIFVDPDPDPKHCIWQKKNLTDRHLTDRDLTDRDLTDRQLTDRDLTDKDLTERDLTDGELSDKTWQLTDKHGLTDLPIIFSWFLELLLLLRISISWHNLLGVNPHRTQELLVDDRGVLLLGSP